MLQSMGSQELDMTEWLNNNREVTQDNILFKGCQCGPVPIETKLSPSMLLSIIRT